MGGGTGTGGIRNVFEPPPRFEPSNHKYINVPLEHPWGQEKERVRTFPPCRVANSINKGDAAVVFVKQAGKAPYRRKRIGYYDIFPSSGFVAWDDTNQEYAWHEVGTIDVPDAKDPRLSAPPQPGKPSMNLLVDQFNRSDLPRSKRKRRSFIEWFLNKAPANDIPDFLQRDKSNDD